MTRQIAAGFVLALLLTAGLNPPMAAAQNGPGWVAGPNGCRAWNSVMQPRRSFSWSGGCEDGLVSGRGTLQWFDNGVPTDRYEGDYSQGKMNGRGVYIAASGERYEGSFKDDARTGPGVYVTVRGDRYQGNFERSVLQGPGVGIFATGERYEGGFWNNRANGKGTLTRSDGTTVAGDWANGCLRQGEQRYAVGVGAEAASCP